MNYLQAQWRGVDRERFEDDLEIASSHPHFGRLTYFRGFDGPGHWEALSSHPRTGVRFTIILPGDRELAFQPLANFYRLAVGDPDVFLRRCSAELVAAYERCTGTAPAESCSRTFVLEGVTLPPDPDTGSAWSATFQAESIDHHFTVHFSGQDITAVKYGATFDLSI